MYSFYYSYLKSTAISSRLTAVSKLKILMLGANAHLRFFFLIICFITNKVNSLLFNKKTSGILQCSVAKC